MPCKILAAALIAAMLAVVTHPTIAADQNTTPHPEDSVVRITIRQPLNDRETLLHRASAVAVSHSQGGTDLLTSAHIWDKTLSAKAEITVETPSTTMKASLVRLDHAIDLALLRIDKDTSLPVAPLAPSAQKMPTATTSVGYDHSRQQSPDGKPLLTRVVEEVSIMGYDDLCWFARDKAEGGRSGGGLFDASAGTLLGIVSRGTSNVTDARPGEFSWPTKRTLYIHRDRIEEFLLGTDKKGN